MCRTVTAAKIYEQVIQMTGVADDESTKRKLRNKMTYLLEQVALRKVSDLKKGRDILIPWNDAPIIRNLLALSIDDGDEGNMFVDWFNGNLDTNDAQICVLLYMQIKEPIMRAEITGETDSVTVDEWKAAIRGVINYDMADRTLKLKRKLENFRAKTLVMNSTVRTGDVIVGCEDGSRYYGLERKRNKKELSEELVKEILKDLYLQEDYFDILNQLMDRMIADAEAKAVPDIEVYAMGKELSGCDRAIDILATKDDYIVSEYYPWFEKIHQYLLRHPEEAVKIENEANTENLTDFFKMK